MWNKMEYVEGWEENGLREERLFTKCAGKPRNHEQAFVVLGGSSTPSPVVGKGLRVGWKAQAE